MKVKFIYIFFILIAVVFSCAKPPLTEMQNAREAVFRAEADENAAMYAPSVLARARDSLRRMQVEADSKRYDAAKTHAQEAIDAANKAIADGKAASSKTKDEAEAMLSGLRPALEEAGRNINGARYSLLNLDYNQLNRELASAGDYTDQAEADQAEGNYQNALDNGRRARSSISGINEKITGAATASSAKK
jgi:vacuolar-type H+-ATPase subunit D/Vma8